MVNKKYYNIFLTICLFALIFLLVKRFIDHDSKIWIIINLNDIISVCAFFLFINKKHFVGMLLALTSFIIYILILILYMPERIIKPTTFFRLIVVVYFIYQIIKDIRDNRNTGNSFPNLKRMRQSQ